MQFKVSKATEVKSKLRMALDGPGGSGKTWTSLAVARELAHGDMSKVLVLDTENNSSAKYAKEFGAFNIVELKDGEGKSDYNPDNYVDLITFAENNGFEVLILDSLSHAWMGKGGALEQVDQAAARSRSGNSFTAWREVTPKHNRLVDAILQANIHVIATMRVKTEYVMEDAGNGKKQPKKLGMAPIQRDGLEYEFDVMIDMDAAGKRAIVSKTRCPELADKVLEYPGAELGQILLKWLDSGEAAVAKVKTKQDLINLARVQFQMGPNDVAKALAAANIAFDPERWDEMVDALAKAMQPA